jgi:alpha-N-arabinofuranosidase
VNRKRDKAITTDIISQTGQFSGDFMVYEVNGPSIKSVNSFEKEEVKTVSKPAVKGKGTKITYSFPAHSFTMITGRIDNAK